MLDFIKYHETANAYNDVKICILIFGGTFL